MSKKSSATHINDFVIFWEKKMGKGKKLYILSSLTTCSQIWLFPPLDDLPHALHHKNSTIGLSHNNGFTLANNNDDKYSTYYHTPLIWIQQQNCRIIN